MLDARDDLVLRVAEKLNDQLDVMNADEETLNKVREWLNVSGRYVPSRRDLFNYVVHLHNEMHYVANWRFILHVYPVANMFSKHILVRVVSGAVCDKWFEWYVDKESFDTFEDLSYPVGEVDVDEYRATVWTEQFKLTPKPYTLTIVDDLEEYATACT